MNECKDFDKRYAETLVVTITLSEYRHLIKMSAEADQRRSDFWKKEEELNKVKQELEAAQKRVSYLERTRPANTDEMEEK